MKLLKPIRFDDYMLKGGSTKPWSISCIDMSISLPEEIPCVLKLFKPSHVSSSNSIGKEFICNALAAEFDLVTPEAYLVDPFDSAFVSVLKPEVIVELQTKHIGLTFCSRMVNAAILKPEVKSNIFNIQDCAQVFAFDCLILNQDRGGYRNKANLMIDDDGFILIDHELSFHFMDGVRSDAYHVVIESFTTNSWFANYSKHLFYGRLKSYRGSKKNLFDTFEEYLSKLDISKTHNLIQDLLNYHVTVGQNDLLIQYLYTLKQNANKFCKILLNLIS